MDPAVLARNVILLTLIADNQTSPTILWNIFYHMRLDSASLAVLVSHCKKLLSISATLNQWCSSAYSHFIGMCTEYTLTELRRHWSLYEAMQNLSAERISTIESEFVERSRHATTLEVYQASIIGFARSAGPLMIQAISVCGELFQKYWNTGGIFINEDEARNNKLLNPTFAYSMGGEGCSVDSTAVPMASFHLASVLGNRRHEPTETNIVTAAKMEFQGWCTSFHKSVVASPPKKILSIRFIVGEATAVCHSLHTYATTGALTAGIPVAKWNTHFIVLDQHEYLARGAPTCRKKAK